MTTTRSIRRDERGQSPFILIASVAVFVIASVGLAAALIASIQASTMVQVSSQLEDTVSAGVREPIRQGYDTVAALPTEAQIPISVGPFAGTATRTVELDAAHRTARVTMTIGKFNGSEFGSAAACDSAPDSCVIVSELVSGAGLGGTP